ncbi:MAG: VWA domain-containing protein [Chlamydiae bacterium]|nr:VWA domain-containing protein [Chlamydiota bacterium]
MKKWPYVSSLWTPCIVGSLLLHSAACYFLVRHPLTFSTWSSSLFCRTSPPLLPLTSTGDASSPSRTLEEFFAEFPCYTQHPSVPIATTLSSPSFLKTPHQEGLPPSATTLSVIGEDSSLSLPSFPALSETSPFPLVQSSPLEQNLPNTPLLPPSLSTPQEFLLQETPIPLEEDRILLPKPTSSSQKLSFLHQLHFSTSAEPLPLFTAKPNSLPSPSLPSSSTSLQATISSLPLQLQEQPLVFSPSRASSIDEYLPISALFSLQWQQEFTIQPSFLPCEDGYLFALCVSPKQELAQQKLHQTIYFLIDTSSSLEKHKISTFKKSVLKALTSLEPSHSFNILLLGKEITKLSPTSIPYSLETLRQAQKFLEQDQGLSFFASNDLFHQVEKALDCIEPTQDVHTVILLTNGSSSTSLADKSQALSRLLEKSAGKAQFFTAAVGQNNTLVHLDMLSSLCGGKLLYSDTNASFPRKLQSFLKTIQSPLLKDLTVSLQTSDPKVTLEILSSPLQLNCLYGETPLVIVGKMNRLSPLQIVVEGRNEEGWILLQKEVLFEGASQGGPLLKKALSSIQATELYTSFLKAPQKEILQQAKELLEKTK